MQAIESEVQSSKSGTGIPQEGLPQLAFGTEKMGLVALKAPLLVGIVFTILAVAAIFGIGKLKVDDSLSQLFRSDTPAFKQYEAVTREFPSSEYDVLVVLTAKDITAEDRRRLAGQADRVLAKGSTGLNELARELRALVPATDDAPPAPSALG